MDPIHESFLVRCRRAKSLGQAKQGWQEAYSEGASSIPQAVLRCLWAADAQGLDFELARLNPGFRPLAISVFFEDWRVSGSCAWDLLGKRIEDIKEIPSEVLSMKSCPDWRPVARLISSKAWSQDDYRSLCAAFSQSWIQIDIQGSTLIERLFKEMSQGAQLFPFCSAFAQCSAPAGGACDGVALDLAMNSLAKAAGSCAASCSDISTGCCSGTYWRSWKQIELAGGKPSWGAWAQSYSSALGQLSATEASTLGVHGLKEAFEALNPGYSATPEEAFQIASGVALAKASLEKGFSSMPHAKAARLSFELEESLYRWVERISAVGGAAAQAVAEALASAKRTDLIARIEQGELSSLPTSGRQEESSSAKRI